MSTADLRDQDFLGGGVHVAHNGHHIVLWLDQESFIGPRAIGLNPDAMKRLDAYRKRVGVTG